MLNDSDGLSCFRLLKMWITPDWVSNTKNARSVGWLDFYRDSLQTVLAGIRMPLLYWVFKSVSILLSILILKVY